MRFIFRRSRVKIVALRPGILNAAFCGFSQYFYAVIPAMLG
jgi:hypothetical protein